MIQKDSGPHPSLQPPGTVENRGGKEDRSAKDLPGLKYTGAHHGDIAVWALGSIHEVSQETRDSDVREGAAQSPSISDLC